MTSGAATAGYVPSWIVTFPPTVIRQGGVLRRLLVTAVLLIIVTSAGTTAKARTWHLGVWSPGINNVYNAVYYEFCGHKYHYCWEGSNALLVVKCETGGTYSTWAKNGQYENIFQMGTSERTKYGWHTVGDDPWKAAHSAYNYYSSSGRDWSPWSCKP